jgi:hypothetical protein
VAVAVRERTSAPSRTGTSALIEARRYRQVARRMDTGAVARALNVRRSVVEKLLDGEVHYLTSAFVRRFERLVSKRTAEWLRGSPRWEGVHAGQMPSTLIAPVIENALGWEGIAATEALTRLPLRTLTRISRDSRGVSIDLADAIFTGLHGAAYWRDNPALRRWYYTTDRVIRQ